MEFFQYDVQLYYQMFYSFHSVEKLFTCCKKENHISIFYYTQNLLVSLSNISKLLCNGKSSETAERCEQYCFHLGVNLNKIPNILNKELRNTNEHIDERIEGATKSNRFYGDMSSSNCEISRFNEDTGSIRFVHTGDFIISFKNRDYKNIKLDLNEVITELNYLKSLEPIDYLFMRYNGFDKIL